MEVFNIFIYLLKEKYFSTFLKYNTDYGEEDVRL